MANSVFLHALCSLEQMADSKRKQSTAEDTQSNFMNGTSELHVAKERPDADCHRKHGERSKRAGDPEEMQVTTMQITSERETEAKKCGDGNKTRAKDTQDVSNIGSCLIDRGSELIGIVVISCGITSSKYDGSNSKKECDEQRDGENRTKESSH